MTLLSTSRNQAQRWHQTLIGECADRSLLGVVEFDACR